MTYVEHIQPLEQAGKTDAEIAAIVSQTTVRPIKRRDARTYLFNNAIEFQDENGVFMGRLKATVEQPLSAWLGENEAPFKFGLRRFLGYLRSVDWENLETNTEREGPSSMLLLAGLIAVNAGSNGALGVTQQQANEFLALGGGLVKANCAAQDVADSRAAYEASITLTLRLDAIDSALQVKLSGLRQQIRDGVDVTETLDALEVVVNA